MSATLALYRERHFAQVMLLYTALYFTMQTFVIPGCFFLALLIGTFLPFVPALLFITVLTTAGCVANFLLSRHVLAALLWRVAATHVATFRAAVARHEGGLFFYLLLLRIVPAFPSWAVNIACPLAGVSLRTFALTTALGFQPQVRN